MPFWIVGLVSGMLTSCGNDISITKALDMDFKMSQAKAQRIRRDIGSKGAISDGGRLGCSTFVPHFHHPTFGAGSEALNNVLVEFHIARADDKNYVNS
jgi:hypothetical protein